MKLAAVLLLLATWAPPSFAQCTGAEARLQSVAKALLSEDTARADALLDALEQSHPSCDETVLDRARSLYLKGDDAEAETAFQKYNELAPDDARGYAHLARLLLEQRQYPRADAMSALALEKDAADPAALALRGQILAMKGHPSEGAAMLEKALQLNPGDAEANYQLGMIYNDGKRRQDAVRLFTKSLALVPGNARAWDYLALNLEPLGEPDRADEAYRKGETVNLRGRFYDAFLPYNYGRFLVKRNQLKDAKMRLDQAVEAAPRIRAVWYERAKVNLSLQNLTDARDDGEQAAALPDQRGVILDLQIYALLGKIYGKLGNHELAEKYGALSRSTPVPVKESR